MSTTTAFDVWGYNQYGVLKTRDLQGCAFSCDPQMGSFDEAGMFHAVSTPATGNLYVTYNGITATQPVTIIETQWVLVSDSVLIDRFHDYAININGISGYGMDKVDPSVAAWTSGDEEVCVVDDQGIITAVADGQTFVTTSHPLLTDSLLVRVENPKARVTTVENGPIDPDTWQVTQSGGKNRVVTALDNGLQIDFTGSSSRNPYFKIAKDVQMWGLPDTIRLRLIPGSLQLKTVKILLETAYDDRVTVEYPVDGEDEEITIDVPVTDVCDATDLGNFPLHLVYYYITCTSPVTNESYSLKIPGMELVYASMPPDEEPAITGDVNGDGEVGIADVNAVIDIILIGGFLPTADVNGDGEVGIADVNAIISLILQG